MKASTATKQTEEKIIDKKYDLKSFIHEAVHPVSLKVIKDHRGRDLVAWQGVYDGQKEKVVAVVNEGYNLLPNKSVLEPILSFLDKEKVKHNVANLTYVSDSRMRLHLTFPEMKIKDDSKEGIISALYIHNSYNGLEAFKIVGGALRQVCTNGMVVMDIVQKARIIHQADEIQVRAEKTMAAVMESLDKSRKLVEAKIRKMMSQQVTAEQLKAIDRHFENSVVAQILKDNNIVALDESASKASEIAKHLTNNRLKRITEWKVYNQLTQHLSHRVPQRYRVQLLTGASRVFGL